MKVRTLTDYEQETLGAALACFQMSTKSTKTRWACEILAEMVKDFMWIESKEKQ